MQFVMGGQVFTLEDLNAQMNGAFIDLIGAFFSDHRCGLNEFESKADQFFTENDGNIPIQDKYFNNFTIIWKRFVKQGNLENAESLWQLALRPALKWESQHQNRFIHKGTPFYFWGMTAILKGDIDRGYILMHRSVQEDVRSSGHQFPGTPAFAFATLNYGKVDQAFREWVLLQAQFLDKMIKTYSDSFNKNLDLETFHSKFLASPPNIDVVFLFAYALARFLRIDKTPNTALSCDFAGQLEMNLLFDIALVIDAAIKAKNTNQWKFIDHAAFLSRKSGLGLNKKRLVYVNKQFSNNFDTTLTQVLDGAFTFTDGTTLTAPATSLATAYALRNHGAHSVSSVATIWRRFLEIRQNIFNTLFLAVEFLY